MAGFSVLGLLGFLLLQIAAPLCQGQICPQACNCTPQRRSVNCQNKHLDSFPNGIPTDTRLLDLSRNKLRWVEHDDLKAYTRLEDLDLSENLISVLEPNAFSSLLNLRVLCLRANQLKLVPMGAFSHLGNLTLLDLSENKLVILVDFTFQDLRRLQKLEVGDNDLVYISNKAFLGLTGLQELTIERCNLTSISGKALSYLRGLVSLRLRYLNIASLEEQNFHKMGGLRGLEIDHWPLLEYISPYSFQGLSLSWLFITNTNITSVPSGALRNLIHLASLNLSYNPISVLESWALRDLVNLKDLHLVGTNLMCVQPYGFGGLQQIRLLNLSNNSARKALSAFSDSTLLDHFTCQRPKIRNRKLQQLSAREGQIVSFYCQADGDPTPTIFWISPQRRRITAKSTGRLIVLPEGTLEIHYVQVADSGTYICIASNAGGNDTYFATLTVSGLPLDASLSSNRTYVGDLNDTHLNDTRVFLKFTLDLKTILVSTAMGCITFLGVVVFCFLLLFLWSRGRGQHKNNFSMEYSFRKVDGPAAGGGQGGARKFNMKMI
ncbi:Leucine-rich repeat and immunoglobulin-like domain-containing nogo receptor-interacting protein 2 [Bagarius yarrelli]|nr:Leucine-rich repeat and immunoglobulin-like domain-containing nogo receptor-interacting protein 2 [Bagarius yarrelli]